MTVHGLRSTRLTMLVAGIGGTAVLLAACSTASTGAASSSGAPSAASSAPASSSASAAPAPGSSASASGPSRADELGVIDPSTLPVTIPFDYVSNHPVVETGFGTAETFPMILDTGAPVNVSADLVEKFAFPVVGQQTGEPTGDLVGEALRQPAGHCRVADGSVAEGDGGVGDVAGQHVAEGVLAGPRVVGHRLHQPSVHQRGEDPGGVELARPQQPLHAR